MPAAPKQRKIAIVGSRSVGKSSLTVRFVEQHFVESYYPTIENTFSRIIKHNGQDYATEIVDTAGQVGNLSETTCTRNLLTAFPSAMTGRVQYLEFKALHRHSWLYHCVLSHVTPVI
jgi:GTPase Era involved in 16S rRNA processing